MPQRARRINRIESPFVDFTFRGDVSLTNLDVWRQDRLVYGDATYLVLDFGMGEELRLRPEDAGDDDTVWMPTGGLVVEIQRIDPDTGLGLAEPTLKELSDASGQVTWTNWQLIPCSPRRPPAEADSTPIDVDEPVTGEVPCVMCGAPSVQVDNAGDGHCPDHIGESPEWPVIAYLEPPPRFQPLPDDPEFDVDGDGQ